MTPIRLSILALTLPLTWPAPASAADDPVTPPAAQAEAWGIVTSQGVTVAGHEFSSHFIAAWRDKPGSERYSLSIRERATARWAARCGSSSASSASCNCSCPRRAPACRPSPAPPTNSDRSSKLAQS